MSIDVLLSAMRSQADTRNMGAAAAKSYLIKVASDDKATLNDAVIEVLKNENLVGKPTTPNFVDRVVEEANKAVFAVKFKSASYMGNIEFPVANASVIKEQLAPAKAKTASFKLDASVSVIEAAQKARAAELLNFISGGREKVAEQDPVSEGEILHKYRTLLDEEKQLKGDMLLLGAKFEDSFAKLASLVESDEHNKQVISGCMAAASPSPRMGEFIKLSFGTAADPNALAMMNSAGMPPMPGNPVTGLVADLDMIGSKLMTAQMAMSKVMSGMAELQAVLKGSGPTTSQLFAPEQAGGVPPMAPGQMPPGPGAPAQPPPGMPMAPGGM